MKSLAQKRFFSIFEEMIFGADVYIKSMKI